MRLLLIFLAVMLLFVGSAAAAPTATIERNSVSAWGNSDAASWNISFSEPISGFNVEDIAISTPPGTWQRDLSSSNGSWRLDVWRSSGTGDGQLSFEILEGSVEGSSGPGPFGDNRFSDPFRLDTVAPSGGGFSIETEAVLPPGSVWQQPQSILGGNWIASARMGPYDLALASGGEVAISRGFWSPSPSVLPGGPWVGVAAGTSLWMALASDGSTRSSASGTLWSQRASLPQGSWKDIEFFDGSFWALSGEGLLYRLQDEVWQEVEDLAGTNWKAMSSQGTRMMILREDGSVVLRQKGSSTLYPSTLQSGQSWNKLESYPGGWIAASQEGRVSVAGNDLVWSSENTGVEVRDLLFRNGIFYALGPDRVFWKKGEDAWQTSMLPSGSWLQLLADQYGLLAVSPNSRSSAYQEIYDTNVAVSDQVSFSDSSPFTETLFRQASGIVGGRCADNWGPEEILNANTAFVKDRCYRYTQKGEDFAGNQSLWQAVVNTSDVPAVDDFVRIDPVGNSVKGGPLEFRLVFSEVIDPTSLSAEDFVVASNADWDVVGLETANNRNWIVTMDASLPVSETMHLDLLGASVQDSSGNLGPSAGSRVSTVVDVETPAPPSWTETPSAVLSADISLPWSPSETGGRVLCALDDNTPTLCANPATWSALSSGPHRVRLWQEDDAGNRSLPLEHNFVVDNQPPDQPLIQEGPEDNSFKNTSSVSFSWSGEGTSSCSWDEGAWQPCISPVSRSGLSEGQHSFSVRLRDQAGNISQPATRMWTVDITPPPSPELTNKPSSLSPSSRATFRWIGEAWAQYQCQFQNGTWEACSSPREFSNLLDGNYLFRLRQIDRAGNTSQVIEWPWRVVLGEPPVPTLSQKPAIFSSSREAAFVFSTTEDGIFQCALDNEDWSTCTSPATYSNLADGPHSFRVRQKNAVDRTGSAASWSWAVDTRAPEAPELLSRPQLWTSSTGAAFSWSGEFAARAQCSLDGGPWSECVPMYELSGLSNGEHVFRVRLLDQAGNISAETAWPWNVDNTVPLAPKSVSGTSGTTSRLEHSFSWQSEDGAQSQCSLDSAPWDNCQSPLSLKFISAGEHRLLVRQIDRAGNIGPTLEWNWTIDLSQPRPPEIIDFPGVWSNDRRASFSWLPPEGMKSQCSVSNREWVSCRSPWEFQVPSAGAYIFRVRSVNDAGTVSVPAQKLWNADFEAPALRSVSLQGSSRGLWKLRLRGRDNDRLQDIAFGSRKGQTEKKMRIARKVRLTTSPVWARVSDRASNWSSWVRVQN